MVALVRAGHSLRSVARQCRVSLYPAFASIGVHLLELVAEDCLDPFRYLVFRPLRAVWTGLLQVDGLSGAAL